MRGIPGSASALSLARRLPHFTPSARIPEEIAVHDSDTYEATLLRAIATQRQQLVFLPLDDPRRDALYRELLRCYHEVFALLYERIAARRAAQQDHDRRHARPYD